MTQVTMRIVMCLTVGFVLALTTSADAQTRECSNSSSDTAFDCSGGENSACTKTVTTPGAPGCNTPCPGGSIACYCSFSPAPAATMTYSGTVISYIWYGNPLMGAPTQECGGDCTYEYTYTDEQMGRFVAVSVYTCLRCTTVGTGVPGTTPSQVCTSQELYPG